MSSRRREALPAAPADQLAALAELLWQQRELLDDLHYRLTAQRLLVDLGVPRWAARADQEVQRAIRLVRECEVLRRMEAESTAASLGLAEAATLRELADAAPEPWSTILADHHRELALLVDQVEELMTSTHAKLDRVQSRVEQRAVGGLDG